MTDREGVPVLLWQEERMLERIIDREEKRIQRARDNRRLAEIYVDYAGSRGVNELTDAEQRDALNCAWHELRDRRRAEDDRP